MTIACLGWGSPCWDPGSLPLAGAWRNDGPILPVEFARVSQDGRITLVLTDEGTPVPTLWVPLQVERIDDAIQALAHREGVVDPRYAIGRWPSEQEYPFAGAIGEWAKNICCEGVVWTALKPGLGRAARGCVPSIDELRSHLFALDEQSQTRAREYLMKAPQQVQTRFRPELINALELAVRPQ